MGILLDIGFVIIILLCVVFGYKKGFFKSIAGFIGAVIAMFLAWVLSVSLFLSLLNRKMLVHFRVSSRWIAKQSHRQPAMYSDRYKLKLDTLILDRT